MKTNQYRSVFFWVLAAIVARACFWTATPLLSNDSYRYLWDGALVTHAIHPWSIAPADVPSHERPGVPLPPDHRDIPSIYPPLSLAIFAGVAKFWPTPLAFSVLATLADAATTLLLALLLQARGRAIAFVALFALHPVAVIESGHSGHVDSIGILFLTWTLWLLDRRKRGSSFALAGAALIKFWPISLLPLLAGANRRVWMTGTLAFLLPTALLLATGGDTGGLATYLRHWEFNGSLYPIASQWSGPVTARVLLGLLFVCAIAFQFRRRVREKVSFEEAALSAVGMFLLCSPTVYPWYTLWLLPFLVLQMRWEWLYFTIAVATSYAILPAYLHSGIWEEPLWPSLVTYLPLYGGLIARQVRREAPHTKQPQTRAASE